MMRYAHRDRPFIGHASHLALDREKVAGTANTEAAELTHSVITMSGTDFPDPPLKNKQESLRIVWAQSQLGL